MAVSTDFSVCPHCWHVNPPSRVCARCFADMTTLLQESGGMRWAAAVQSPVPVRVGNRLSRGRRAALLTVLVLFALGQLALALGSAAGPHAPPAAAAATDD